MFRVYRSLEAVGPEARPCVLSIGNFDGVHAGHRRLFRRTLELARHHGWIPAAFTFHPHPATIVAPDRAPRLLTTIEQRIELMRSAGIEQIFVVPFDREFSLLGPEDFVGRVLVETCGARAVLVGANFRFGHRQAGNIDTLRQLGDRHGLLTEVVPAVRVRGRMVSSTAVRQLIDSGAVSLACRLLERPYCLEGDIVRGEGVGSKQTVPTLNLDTRAEVLPARGVYVTRTEDLDRARVWPSITNIGVRPTFSGDRLTIETFLLEPPGEPPARIRLELLRRVREERRFESAEALKQQILRDVNRAQAYFRRLRTLTGSRTAL